VAEDREQWLEWRREGIGGSDAAAVAGLDPFKSPMAIYLDKAGLLPLDGGEDDEPRRWGRRFEDAIVEEFQERSGLFVAYREERVTHPTHPFLRATLDGLVYGEPQDGRFTHAPLGIYEAKTASRRAWEWQDGVPDHVALQCQHNMAVMGLDRAYLAALLLTPIPRLTIHEVERDEAAIEVLAAIETDFWQRVQERRPPAVDGTDATTDALKAAYASPNGHMVEMTPEALDAVRRRMLAAKDERVARERRQLAESELMTFLGDNEVGHLNGRIVVTWKPYTQKRVDAEALRRKLNFFCERHPRYAGELREVPTTTTTSRRLYFKPLAQVDTDEEDDRE
jgi:putative phage-type endonuclease